VIFSKEGALQDRLAQLVLTVVKVQTEVRESNHQLRLVKAPE
jgi:hypothetical protein